VTVDSSDPAQDTIFALATAPGQAGVAVVRVSGPLAGAALEALTRQRPPPARQAALRTLRHPVTGELMDRPLILHFPSPHSFTGEDVVELHLHGGRAVVSGVLEALAERPGLRPAEAGEFSRRAFIAGKLDLTQAEGLADLVAAETAAQRRQALRQFEGGLGAIYESWRTRLISLLAHTEATIDFPDEDVPADDVAAMQTQIAVLRDAFLAHLDDDGKGERLRDGIQVAIVGAPNVGKSSLLNRLAQRDVAIVSETAGTTRDVIEVHLDLGGYPVVVADTAGVRAAGEEIEREGVRRALARAAAADVRLLVLDATDPIMPDDLAGLQNEAAVVVANKCDLANAPIDDAVSLSAKTGEGIDALLDRLGELVIERFSAAEAPALTRARHRQAVNDAAAALARAMAATDEVLRAEDLRLAARFLGRITGRVDVEDILDVVFADFCIGK